MIDINLVRQDAEKTGENLSRRGVKKDSLTRLKKLDDVWLEITRQVEAARAAQNLANNEIAAARGEMKEAAIAKMRELASQLKDSEQQLAAAAQARAIAWRALPNLVAEDVPAGGAKDFEILRTGSVEIKQRRFEIKSYLNFEGELFNLEEAARVSGSGFAYILGDLARLQMGLVAWVFDLLAEDDFLPVIPPVLVGKSAIDGMGYLGEHEDEVYKTQDDLYLAGTSEQSIGAGSPNFAPMNTRKNYSRFERPRRFVGYSSCFRREAGSHGKNVRGLKRLHQFEKIEMFSFTRPEDSSKEHEFLLAKQEQIMQALELPYRVIKLAAGDLGAPAAKTYDIETWIPSEENYLETHSTSNTTDYQARRLNIRFKDESGTRHLHMLNGTALAMSRIFIALLENHQQEDGSIKLPKVLYKGKYVPFKTIEVRK